MRKIDQLERVVKYTFNNVGNTFSAKSISDYLKAEHRSLDNETVYSYLEKLEKAYLLHRCSRYDLQFCRINHEWRMRSINDLVFGGEHLINISQQIILCFCMQIKTGFIQQNNHILMTLNLTKPYQE